MVLSFCLTTNQSIGRVKHIYIWINPSSNFGDREYESVMDSFSPFVSKWVTNIQARLKEWMGIDREDQLRLSHVSLVSMQSKNIYYFPCDYGKNQNIFFPMPDIPQRLYSYSPSGLGSFEHVFTKGFFGHFFAHNVCLAPFFGTDWSEPVPDRVLLRANIDAYYMSHIL